MEVKHRIALGKSSLSKCSKENAENYIQVVVCNSSTLTAKDKLSKIMPS